MSEKFPDGGSKNRGFAGLDGLVSDIESSAPKAPVRPSANAVESGPQTQTPEPFSPATQAPAPAPAPIRSATASSADVGGSDGSGTTGIVWTIVAACVLLGALFLATNLGRAPAKLEAPPALSPAPQQNAPPAFAPTLAVAAVTANVRSEGTAKASIVSKASRGTSLERLDESTGFIKVRLPDQREGWIARELVIGQADAARLSAMTAIEYIQSRQELHGIDKLFDQLQPHKPLLSVALYETSNESANLDSTLDEIANTVHVSVTSDLAAGIWFSLDARANSDKNMNAEALASARAAIQADPANADYHVAFGYAAFNAGDLETVGAVASILPLLSPNSTNTWVLAGIAAATKELVGLPEGAFLLALRKSKNPKVTVKVLTDIAARTNDAHIAAAISKALERWATRSQRVTTGTGGK